MLIVTRPSGRKKGRRIVIEMLETPYESRHWYEAPERNGAKQHTIVELETDGEIKRRTDGTCTIADDVLVVMTKHWKV